MPDYPSLPVRVWRMRPWQHNVLLRPSDRLLVLVRALAALAVLGAVPVAGAAGTAEYTAAAARITTENAAKVVVQGIIIADPRRTTVASGRGDTLERRAEAPVSWSHDGRSGTATVDVPVDAHRGEQIPIWLGPDAVPTSAPRQPSAAVVEGTVHGLLVLFGCWVGALAVVVGTTWLHSIQHSAGWAREWRAVDRRIGTDR